MRSCLFGVKGEEPFIRGGGQMELELLHHLLLSPPVPSLLLHPSPSWSAHPTLNISPLFYCTPQPSVMASRSCAVGY